MKIQQQEGTIDAREWRFLLAGPTAGKLLLLSIQQQAKLLKQVLKQLSRYRPCACGQEGGEDPVASYALALHLIHRVEVLLGSGVQLVG
jgi:hypothetical protein